MSTPVTITLKPMKGKLARTVLVKVPGTKAVILTSKKPSVDLMLSGSIIKINEYSLESDLEDAAAKK